MRKIVFGFVLVIAIFAIILAFKISRYNVFNEPYSMVILDRNNNLLSARIADDQQWRFPPMSRVNDRYVKALVEYEDKRFFYHFGIDPIAVVRAFWKNIKNKKRISGASTISMQVVRISRKKSRTYLEKIIEMFLAIVLEIKYSKHEILLMYAEHAPFGGNIVGISAASRFYFRRDVSELTWAESALFAVLPNNPSMIHPGRNRKMLKKKRDKLLYRLYANKEMDSIQYKLSLKEELPFRLRKIKQLTPQLLNSIKKYDNNKKSLYNTTLDKDIQEEISDICEHYSMNEIKKNIRNLAAVVVDNKTGEVVAYVANTHSNRHGNYGQFIDLVQSRRSSGSILKPLLFYQMIKSGAITPQTLVYDIPTQYGGFIPSNYNKEFKGAVAAKYALAHSLNVPFVRMLNYYGVNVFYNDLKNMGITTLSRSADDYGLTLILGGAEVKLLEMVNAYSFLAQSIISDSTVHISLIKKEKLNKRMVYDNEKASAYITIQALLDVNRPGNERYWKNFSSSKKIAWKTGTSFGYRDAWAIGVNPGYTVGVWVGNANGEGVPGISGIEAAAPLMFSIFNFLGEQRWFKEPLDVFDYVDVCTKSGMLATPLCKSEKIRIPKNTNFTRVCPFHKLINLDTTGTFQVDSRYESVNRMKSRVFFQLPPLAEFYYMKSHPDYRKVPSFMNKSGSFSNAGMSRIAIVYPEKNSNIYIPVDLNGARSAVVMQAVCKDEDDELFWHIDKSYIGSTKLFHTVTVNDLKPGRHVLTVCNSRGDYCTRKFNIVDVDKK